VTIAEELAETRERVRQGIALACAMERRDRERRASFSKGPSIFTIGGLFTTPVNIPYSVHIGNRSCLAEAVSPGPLAGASSLMETGH
jgi:hypothetical protein